MLCPEAEDAAPLACPAKALGNEKVGEESDSLLKSGMDSSSESGSGALVPLWHPLDSSA